MNSNQAEIKLYYQRTLSVWESFCQLHKELYDLTCDEYLTLLESDIDKLETMLIEKEEIIAKIAEIEKERSELILNLNAHQIFQGKISKASELINAFSSLESQAGLPALKNLNSLLLLNTSIYLIIVYIKLHWKII